MQGQGARKGRQARAGLQQESLLVTAGLLHTRRGEQERRQHGQQRREIPVGIEVEPLPHPSFLRE